MSRTLPILCSASVVRNLLSGAQTEDRRPLRPQPNTDWIGLGCLWYPGGPEIPRSLAYDGEAHFRKGAPKDFAPWQAGDLLYVRETWRSVGWRPENGHWIEYADGVKRWAEAPADTLSIDVANPAHPERWRPSIHMPKWAARIHLRVLGVGVERVGDITEAGARAEGCADVAAFDALWVSLYPALPFASTWAWVTKFERVTL